MRCHLCIHLEKEDKEKIGTLRPTDYCGLAMDLGNDVVVFGRYDQFLELLDKLTEGLAKVRENLKTMTEEESRALFLKTEGWIDEAV